MLVLWAEESAAGIGRVHVEPDAWELADCGAYLRQVVEGTAGRGAQGHRHEERDPSGFLVFFHCLKSIISLFNV